MLRCTSTSVVRPKLAPSFRQPVPCTLRTSPMARSSDRGYEGEFILPEIASDIGEKSIWIFGYGSLIHNPGFEYATKVEGYIKGWRRVFWQGSTDHRGTPEAPGRTVTLHQDESSITWGAAYELAGDHKTQEETLHYLEWREKQYDVRHTADIIGPDSSVLVEDCLVYIASPNREHNTNYLGPAPPEDIAAQIAFAHGPSGPNCEYLYKLADSMRKMNVDDAELFDLERRVKMLLAERDAKISGRAVKA